MSLINQQMLLQAKSDRDDALHRLSTGEDTQKVRDLLAGANKRITRIEKEMAQQVAKAEADRKAAAEKAAAANKHGKKAAGGGGGNGRQDRAPRQERAPLPEDVELVCTDCGCGFPFTGKDQVFFAKNDWNAPSRCADCREAKKSAKPTGTDLTCCDCEGTFFFSDGKARVFEEKGWEQPKRCHDCSVAHKSMAPVLIHCEGCTKDFSFSVSAQKDFKSKGWAAPKRCRDCLRAKHEKKDAASVKSGSAKGSVKA